MGRDDSESPPRGKRSPSRKDRSPARQRSTHTRDPQRKRSPKHPKSRSPAPSLPIREKASNRVKSPRRRKSASPAPRSPVRDRKSPRKRKSISPGPPSPVKGRTSSLVKSPRRRKSISPASQAQVREKLSSRTRSPKRAKSRSPVRSPSPRTKRLKRFHDEREAEKATGSEHEKNHNRREDKSSHREIGSDKEVPSERNSRRLGNNGVNDVPSRSRRGRSPSPADNPRRIRQRSSSPSVADRRSRDEGNLRETEQGNDDIDSVSRMKAAEEALEAKEKQKPSFELSGKLAAETNRVRGVTLLFTEPPDARKPDVRWRLYVFKAGEVLNEPLYIHRQSCYLFGRERRVADIPTDHPSCSKQHAVLQYRQVEKEKPDGTLYKQVRPYIMDLGSTNGTFINDNRLEPERYYELIEKDTIKFGNSSREYVMLHENSAS